MNKSLQTNSISLAAYSRKRKVILGVAESDAHVVANHLIAFLLRSEGFEVINLGACTPVSEFVDAYEENYDAEAILIGSLNGHALNDLAGIRQAKDSGRIRCPVILGGNISVGHTKCERSYRKLLEIGIDRILENHSEILPVLLGLKTAETFENQIPQLGA